jgi:type II restriction enzyme
MITGNKGEWSEIYALLKLLGDKKLHPGNSQIKKIENLFYPILRILRTDVNGSFEYSIDDDIVIISGSQEVFRIPIFEFQKKAEILLTEIKNNSGAFSVPEIEEFMHSIKCLSLKASSTSKTDITIVVHDLMTGLQPTLGFSIKSQLGNPATLLNAGETTNFIFEITGLVLNQDQILRINAIASSSKIKDRLLEIKKLGGDLKFVRTQRNIFSNNLILIDSFLPQILADLVFNFYTSNQSNIEELLDLTESKNPLGYDTTENHLFYNYKMKRFLSDIALGMMPSKVWTGEYEANGGYLVVKSDGEILCYHIYNKNEFENYLLANTKLETASSGKHGFGTVYEESGNQFIKLNLQIRFK